MRKYSDYYLDSQIVEHFWGNLVNIFAARNAKAGSQWRTRLWYLQKKKGIFRRGLGLLLEDEGVGGAGVVDYTVGAHIFLQAA